VGLGVNGLLKAVTEPEFLAELGVAGIVHFAFQHFTAGSEHDPCLVNVCIFEVFSLLKTII